MATATATAVPQTRADGQPQSPIQTQSPGPRFLTATFGEGVLGFRLLNGDANADLEGAKYHAQVAKISGPAEAAGVTDGMLVYEINSVPFRNLSALDATLQLREAAKQRPLTITFVLIPAARPVSVRRPASQVGGGSSAPAPAPPPMPSRFFVPIQGQPSQVSLSIELSKEFPAEVAVGAAMPTASSPSDANGSQAATNAETQSPGKKVTKNHYAVQTTVAQGQRAVQCVVNRRYSDFHELRFNLIAK